MSRPGATGRRARQRPPALLPGELRRVACAFGTFFLILCSYYILRPVRDEMAVRFGADKLQWLFSATFVLTLLVVPLYGWVVRVTPRRRVLPMIYGILIVCLLGFQAAIGAGSAAAGAIFFVWLSVFNLFVVSLFWSRMGDCFSTAESHRLYGYIAAGGTGGAVAGPAMTAMLARHVETAHLLGLSAALLALAIGCALLLRAGRDTHEDLGARPVGGSVIAGIPLVAKRPELRTIALLMLCYTTVSTVLYVEMVRLAGLRFETSGERTSFFAGIDLIVNTLTLGLQLLGTRRIVVRFGLRTALPVVPALLAAALAALAFWRGLSGTAAAQILHRAGEYALGRPGREMIYTGLDPESRYKAKNFIDTAVYRAGDAGSAWVIAGLRGLGLDAVLFVALPAVLLWLACAFRLGAWHDRNQST